MRSSGKRLLLALCHRLIAPVREGWTPERLTLSVVLGLCVGTFPILGATVLICLVLSVVLRLNLVVTQIVNQIAGPIQLLVFLPLVRVGEYIFNAPPMRLTLDELWELVAMDGSGALRVVAMTLVYAVGAWLLLAPLAGGMLYLLLKPLLVRALNAAR